MDEDIREIPETPDPNALIAFLFEQRRWVRERYEDAQHKIQSSSESYRSIRAVLIVSATFLIPLFLGLASLNLLSTSAAINISLLVGTFSGFGSVAATIGDLLHKRRSTQLGKEYSPLGYAMDVYINAFTSEQAKRGGDDKGLASEFYAASTIVFTALIYQLLKSGAKYLDDETKGLMQQQVDYMCNKQIAQWDALKMKRTQTVLNRNAALGSAVSAYRDYCESKMSPRTA